MKNKQLKVYTILLLIIFLFPKWSVDIVASKEEQVITVGTSGTTKPMNFHDEQGELTGFEIELLKEVERRSNHLKFVFELTDFPSLLAGLDSKKFDIVANNFGESEERREKYLFSLYPYVISHNKLITGDPSSKDLTFTDLVGKRFGVVASSPQAIFLEKYNQENPDKTVQIIYVDSHPAQIIQDVHNGRLDAAIYSTMYINDVQDTYGFKVKASPIENEDAIKPPGSYFIYRPEDKAIRDEIDGIIEEMREDGTLKELSEQFIGQDDTQLTSEIIHKNQQYNEKFEEKFANNSVKVGDTNHEKESVVFKPQLIPEIIGEILPKLPLTLWMALGSELIGLILGFIFCWIKIKKVPVLSQIITLFISFMRGTPQLIQLFLAYYGFPILIESWNLKFGTAYDVTTIPSLVYIFVAFGLCEAAYNSEVFRSAIKAVDKTEIEAAYSIGMTSWQTIRRIILPNAIVVALPNLSNSLIRLLKGTSLAFTITIVDIMGQARILAGSNLRYFEAYIAVAIIYWLTCLLIELLVYQLDKYFDIDYRYSMNKN